MRLPATAQTSFRRSRRTRGWTLALSLAGLLVAACGDDSGQAAPAPAAPKAAAPVLWPAWGSPAPIMREPAYIDAQLRRAAGDAGLAEAMGFADARRDQAIWSLARIGGAAARERLAVLLDEDGGSAATLAALAMLEGPANGGPEDEAWRALEDSVWRRFALSEDPVRSDSLMLVIARIGGEASVKRLGIELGRHPSADATETEIAQYESAMSALGILCARGFALDPTTRDAIGHGLDKSSPPVRRAATYALGRCARASTELFALAEERKVIAARLDQSLDGASDEQRRLAWIAFGAIGEVPEQVHPSILGAQGPTWWVEVEAVRALVQSERGRVLALERVQSVPMAAWSGARVHVLLELLRGFRSHAITQKKIEPVLKDLQADAEAAFEAAPVAKQRELSHIRCELAALTSIRSGSLEPLRACRGLALPLDPTAGLEVEALLAMSDAVMNKGARLDALIARAQDADARVAQPALAALAEVDDDAVNAVLQSALERDDLGVVAAAAGAVATRSRDAGKRSLDVVPALRRVVARLSNDDGIEARLAAIEALGVLARQPESGVKPGKEGSTTGQEAPWLESVVLPLARDPAVAVRTRARAALAGRPELLARYDRPVPVAGRDAFGAALESQLVARREKPAAGLRLKTEIGDVVIDLRGARAPMNQANLLALVRRGFFDGLRFHRVAAGFVVQGGDPRGDGYGGPGHLVPCEWSNLRYERGTVGIALAGKDTGGSQIFVTQTRQPHLDARYTVVGRVVEGMQIVDQILPGDAIVSIEVLEHLDASATAPAAP